MNTGKRLFRAVLVATSVTRSSELHCPVQLSLFCFKTFVNDFVVVTSLQFDVLDRLGGFPTIGKRRHGRNNASLCCVTEAAVAERTDHRLHTQPRVLGGRQVSYNRESELGRWRQAYCYQPRFDGEHATRFLVEDSGVQPGDRKPSGVVTHFRRLAADILCKQLYYTCFVRFLKGGQLGYSGLV